MIFVGFYMIYFLLFIFAYSIKAAENTFTLILTDKENEQHKVLLNEQDLKIFTLLHQSCNIPNDQSPVVSYACSNEILSYESFVNVLQPLSKIQFKEERLPLMPEEIRESSDLFKDTINVLEWIEQNQPDNQILIEAFKGADFLQLPLAIKRGIVNYLYDRDTADKLINQEDLDLNKSEWLISNAYFHSYQEWRTFQIGPPFIGDQNDYTILDFENKQIRFFDALKAIEILTTFFFPNYVFKWFNFKNNKIKTINLEQLKQEVAKNFPVKLSRGFLFFDFTNNPLSQEVKNNIVKSGVESDIFLFLRNEIKALEKIKKDIKRNDKWQNYISFKFYSVLMSFAAFSGTYWMSSKIFLQSRVKSLTHGLKALLFVSPLIFYLYKNKNKIFTPKSSKREILRIDKMIESETDHLAKLEKSKKPSEKIFLIDNLFYIKYTE